MNEIIKVNEETQTVSARELHEKLEIGTKFTTWFERMCEYGFAENSDYRPISQKWETAQGNMTESKDYEISIDMAKQICMIQRSEVGKQIRQYFIDLEKAWNTPEQIMARALRVAEVTIANCHKQIEEMKPKADFYDSVADSKTAIQIGDVAKMLAIKGVGRNNLFQMLRDKKILDRNNVPYQQYVDSGYFRVIEQKYTVGGDVRINIKTLVYQKGIDWIRRILATEPIPTLIEE